MRIATLNMQNLKLEYDEGQEMLHGARDSDVPEDAGLDTIDRSITAQLLKEIDADVVALQEVFDAESLDYFHDAYLRKAGMTAYQWSICLPGNDGRGLDVALLSRRPPDSVKSHASLRLPDIGIEPPAGFNIDVPIFRRDCLMITIGEITFLVCHFKSPYPDAEKARTTRRLEALATRHIIETNFRESEKDLWLIIGDLNEPDKPGKEEDRAIAPIEKDFAVDLMRRIPAFERWTYFDPGTGSYHCPDALLASRALAARWPDAKPVIVRRGLGSETTRFHGTRLDGVGTHRPHASDHAAVFIDLDGL